MKDRELTRLLQAHPEEGLEAAMLEYAPLVKGILCRILPQNPCDREECMADVFVALWQNAAKLEATCTPLRPWLAVAARNRGIDGYNALRRRETVALDDGLAETLGELAEFDRATTEAADLVGALVAAMSPPDRDIFLRKYYLLQSGKEIAAALEGRMSMEEAIAKVKQATRNFAKRQLTWFRRDPRTVWIAAGNRSAAAIAEEICQRLQMKPA